jgi:hypothetical protein
VKQERFLVDDKEAVKRKSVRRADVWHEHRHSEDAVANLIYPGLHDLSLLTVAIATR